MRKNRFTEESIAYALRQAEAGTPAGEICRNLEIITAEEKHGFFDSCVTPLEDEDCPVAGPLRFSFLESPGHDRGRWRTQTWGRGCRLLGSGRTQAFQPCAGVRHRYGYHQHPDFRQPATLR